MAVTTKKQFAATTNATTTVFNPVSIQLNNQDDLDVYVTLSGGTRVLQLRQSTGSTAQSSHPQVSNTDGLYFPAVSAGTTLYNYTLSSDNNTITFNSALPSGAVVFCERRTRDADSAYTSFASGSTIRATDLNNSATESNFTAQEARNKAFDLENAIFNGNQPTIDGVVQPYVSSATIVDGTIVNADIADDAITMAKLAGGTLPTDITVASANLVNGTVDTVDIADDAVTADKLANSINTEITANTAKITNQTHTGEVTGATSLTITADAVTGAKIADDQIDSEHYAHGSIDTLHIADNQVTTAKLGADAVTGAKIADDSVDSEHFAAGSIDEEHIANLQVTTGKIANDAITIGKIGCEQTTISNSDSHIPTSGAVVDYVAAQIAPIGGLEVIADEDNFPTSQPSSGVIISISDAAGIVVSGSGVSTTARTAGNGSDNVTINNFPSSLYSETLATGVGLMVSSTGSSNTYNYHKILAAETDVKRLSDDINDFNARYRVNAGEPGSSNDEGDLVFDTSASKMKVYDGSSWGEVTSTGQFKHLFLCPAGGSGAPTINGSIATYDLREVSNSGTVASITNAAQLLVSVNGVIQKANTGTSAPAEGFAMVDANTIIFGANLESGDSIFIVQIGSAVSIPTPGDDTVSTAKIVNDAVDGTKIADDSINSEHYVDASIDHVHLANDCVDGDNITDNSINSEHYVDASIDTAHIADDQVTLAKMAGLARGKIIYGDASGNPAALAIGTSGFTLISDGTDISWGESAAGANGGGSDKIFWENGQTVTTNYTITNNYNAMSAGPITINNGIAVTIGTGENWTIV